MSAKPDAIQSSIPIKSEPDETPTINQSPSDDPIIRTTDVYISPQLSNTLHLLQFPIQPAATSKPKPSSRPPRAPEPIDAKYRPVHHMLELSYPIPAHAKGVPDRPLPDTMCLSSRTFSSTHIKSVTHMALGKLSPDGTKLDIIPMLNGVMQMRPSFNHLHLHDDEEDEAQTKANDDKPKSAAMQKKEAERSAVRHRNSYAYKRASEEAEDWIQLDVHGNSKDGRWTPLKKEVMERIKCIDRERKLKLSLGMGGNEGYVRSLNYLDSAGGFVGKEDLSDWKPSAATGSGGDNDFTMDNFEDFDAEEVPSAPVGETEKAAAELAAKLVVLLQAGNGQLVPYRVIRSRLNTTTVSDEVLTMALSSCALLVRGNFCLKSTLAQFISSGGTASAKGRTMRELRDLILLLLNMHGMVQRERLIRVFCKTHDAIITPETITFLLQTVAQRSKMDNCWYPKVRDDENFAARFPEVAALHGVYWVKKKGRMKRLVERYELALDEVEED